MVGNAETGARTQVALLGPQDYETWLAHSDMYPRGYGFYFPYHPWHVKVWRSAARKVPVKVASKNVNEGILAGVIVVAACAVVGGVVAYSKSRA